MYKLGTSKEFDPQTLEALAVVFTSIGAAIVGLYHVIYRHISKKVNHENYDTLISNRVTKLEQRFDNLEEDIKEYRVTQSNKLDRIIENQNSISSDISFIKGRMSKRDKATP